jgi:hypothetical protein
MPDDQKLSAPSFELMTAGIRIGTDTAAFGAPVAANLSYEEIIVDSAANTESETPPTSNRLDAQSLFLQVQWGAANQSAARKAGAAKYRATGIGVTIVEQRFAIVPSEDTTAAPVATNLSFSEAKAALRTMRRANPAAFTELNVVAETQGANR